MRTVIVATGLLCILLACPGLTMGQSVTKPLEHEVSLQDAVETHHTITVQGESLSYVARTGFIPLLDSADKVLAQIFYVAYEKEGEEKRRPALPCLAVGKRLKSFDLVELSMSREMAEEEARRCLNCDLEE